MQISGAIASNVKGNHIQTSVSLKRKHELESNSQANHLLVGALYNIQQIGSPLNIDLLKDYFLLTKIKLYKSKKTSEANCNNDESCITICMLYER